MRHAQRCSLAIPVLHHTLECRSSLPLSQSARGSMRLMNWIGWALLSAVFAAATALLAKVGVAHVDSNLATAVRTTVVVVFAWGIALALGKHGEIRIARPPHLDVPDALRRGHGPLVDLLLPRPAARPGIARSPARQAQRAAGDAVRMDAAGRRSSPPPPSSAAC